MKRNLTFRTSKFSLLLFGAGLGLVSLATLTYAQTSIELPAPRGSENDENTEQNPLDAISTIRQSNWPRTNRTHADQDERVITVLPTVEATEVQNTKDGGPILVDPVVFERHSRNRPNAYQPDVRNIEEPSTFKFPVRANTLNVSSAKSADQQNEFVQAKDNLWAPLKPLSHAPKPAASSTDRFAQIQVLDTLKPLGQFATTTIPTTIQNPFAIAQRTSWESSGAMVQPAPIAKEPSRAPSTRILNPIPTPIPTPIAIVKRTNWASSNKATRPPLVATNKRTNRAFLNKMLQPIPPSIPTPIAIAKRTSWSPTSHLLQPNPAANAISNPSNVSATDTTAVNRRLISHEQTKQPEYELESGLAPAPVSVFIEGPDYLNVNQSGDYEIAVVNSSSETAYVSSICLRIPKTAEMQVIEREARIDDLERTLTWSVAELGPGQQEQIRFRLKLSTAGDVDFPVTVSQDGREPRTVSQTTYVQ